MVAVCSSFHAEKSNVGASGLFSAHRQLHRNVHRTSILSAANCSLSTTSIADEGKYVYDKLHNTASSLPVCETPLQQSEKGFLGVQINPGKLLLVSVFTTYKHNPLIWIFIYFVLII